MLKVSTFGRTNIDLYTDMKNVWGLVFGFEKFPNGPHTGYSKFLKMVPEPISYVQTVEFLFI